MREIAARLGTCRICRIGAEAFLASEAYRPLFIADYFLCFSFDGFAEAAHFVFARKENDVEYSNILELQADLEERRASRSEIEPEENFDSADFSPAPASPLPPYVRPTITDAMRNEAFARIDAMFGIKSNGR